MVTCLPFYKSRKNHDGGDAPIMSASARLREIKNALAERKVEMLKGFCKQVEEGTKVKPIPIEELERREKTEFKIKTGTLIDELIGGGIPEAKSMMLYGELASGKTQTCLTTAVLCPDVVIYIDTEGSFRAERLEQICETRGLNWEEIKKKVIYFRPKTWADQLMVLFSLPSPMDIDGKLGLIICDSISKHFRGVEFVGRENLQIKNGLIREFILALERIAELHKAALIYTTQIYDKVSGTLPMAGPAQTQAPIGGRSAEHQPDFVLHFRKGKGNIRIARMMDSSWNSLGERAFVLNEKGIDNIPETSTAFSAEDARAKKFARRQQQEKIKKRVKKCKVCKKPEKECICPKESENG